MFFERFKELCEEKQMTVTGFLKKMDWSTSKVTYWKTSPPSVDTINKIADYFNVSTDYLLGKIDIKKPVTTDDDGLSELDLKIINDFQKLTPEGQKQVLAFLDFVKHQP